MKKFIILLALLMTTPVYAAVSNISNSPAVYVNGRPFDKSLIMKASYNANTNQIVILYGDSKLNQVISMPGTLQDVNAINAAKASWKVFFANQEKTNQEELYKMQEKYGDTYVDIEKRIATLRKQPYSVERDNKISKLEDARSAWMRHMQGEDTSFGKSYIQIMQEAGLSINGIPATTTSAQQNQQVYQSYSQPVQEQAQQTVMDNALDTADTVLKMINLFK